MPSAAAAKWISGSGSASGAVHVLPEGEFVPLFNTTTFEPSSFGSASFDSQAGIHVEAYGGAELALSASDVGLGIRPGSSVSVSGIPTDGFSSVQHTIGGSASFRWNVPDSVVGPEASAYWNAARVLFPTASYNVHGNVAPGDTVSISVSLEIGPSGNVLDLALPSLIIDEPGPFSVSDGISFIATPSQVLTGGPLTGTVNVSFVGSISINKGDGGGTTTVGWNPPQMSIQEVPEPSTLILLCSAVLPLLCRVPRLSRH